MKKIFLAVMAVLLVAGLAVVSDARMRGKGEGPRHKEMGEHMMMDRLAGLGLSDQQTAEIKAIHARTKKDMIRKRADLKVADLELQELLDKDPVDMKAVEGKVKQVEDIRTDLRMSHIRAHEEVRSKLTPEQRKKFGSMHGMQSMGCMMGDCSMMGSGGGKGGCAMMHEMDDHDGGHDKDQKKGKGAAERHQHH